MKEMIYQSTRLKEPEMLASGEYNGYNYYVISQGTHPCGYVEIPQGNKYFNVDYDIIPVECHGGLTYGRDYLCGEANIDDGRYFIGWDYAHYGDYVGYWMGFIEESLHVFDAKYTTEDIVRECKDVIEQLIRLEEEG